MSLTIRKVVNTDPVMVTDGAWCERLGAIHLRDGEDWEGCFGPHRPLFYEPPAHQHEHYIEGERIRCRGCSVSAVIPLEVR